MPSIAFPPSEKWVSVQKDLEAHCFTLINALHISDEPAQNLRRGISRAFQIGAFASYFRALLMHLKAKEIPQAQLAFDCGVTDQAVSRWNSGASNIKAVTLHALELIYGEQFDDFVPPILEARVVDGHLASLRFLSKMLSAAISHPRNRGSPSASHFSLDRKSVPCQTYEDWAILTGTFSLSSLRFNNAALQARERLFDHDTFHTLFDHLRDNGVITGTVRSQLETNLRFRAIVNHWGSTYLLLTRISDWPRSSSRSE